MAQLIATLRIVLVLTFCAFVALPAAMAQADGSFAYSFSDVKIVSATKDGSEPFEVNSHYTASSMPAVYIEGTLKVSWDLSIFESSSSISDAMGKKTAVYISVGEDDTTPSPVGFISNVWADLYPEINDEEGLAGKSFSFSSPGNSSSTTLKFKIPVSNQAFLDNDDESDFEFVLHIAGTGSHRLGGKDIGDSEEKHFLPSVDVKFVKKEVKGVSESENDPDYSDLNR